MGPSSRKVPSSSTAHLCPSWTQKAAGKSCALDKNSDTQSPSSRLTPQVLHSVRSEGQACLSQRLEGPGERAGLSLRRLPPPALSRPESRWDPRSPAPITNYTLMITSKATIFSIPKITLRAGKCQTECLIKLVQNALGVQCSIFRQKWRQSKD